MAHIWNRFRRPRTELRRCYNMVTDSAWALAIRNSAVVSLFSIKLADKYVFRNISSYFIFNDDFVQTRTRGLHSSDIGFPTQRQAPIEALRPTLFFMACHANAPNLAIISAGILN